MYMTDEEIRRSYREAKDKVKQIEILADMNITSKREIKEKLTELGEIEETKERNEAHPSQSRCARQLSPSRGEPRGADCAEEKPTRNDRKGRIAEGDEDCRVAALLAMTGTGEARVMDELRAMQLYEEGLDDAAMADALGVKEEKIKEWRRRMKLKRKAGRKALTACGGAPMPGEQEERIATPSCATVRNGKPLSRCATAPLLGEPREGGLPQQSADCIAMTEETEVSETKERMTVERMLTVMERLANAGLGKCPLQITGGKINDIRAVTVMLRDGRIEIDLTEL